MKVLVFMFLFFLNYGFSQDNKKEFKGITLIEEYTSTNYSTPDSLLFFSRGHWEYEKYYQILFKKLKKEFKKSKVITEFFFENNDSISSKVNSFEEMEYKYDNLNKRIVCVFSISNIDSNLNRISQKTGQSVFINPKRIMYYLLYMILIDQETSEILLKRKFSVEANEIYYSNNRNLAKAIAQEIKM